jgi:hypothetical protein
MRQQQCIAHNYIPRQAQGMRLIPSVQMSMSVLPRTQALSKTTRIRL